MSVFWHYIDENSLKTPPGHKKPFTAACHADIKNHLRPHGLLKVHYFINFVKKSSNFGSENSILTTRRLTFLTDFGRNMLQSKTNKVIMASVGASVSKINEYIY